MFAHPLFVPVMMCSPETVNTATVVMCFASAAARFSSISPSSAPGRTGRFGALAMGYFRGVMSEMSTRYGESSKSAQTKRLLLWVSKRPPAAMGALRVQRVQFSAVDRRIEADSSGGAFAAFREVPDNHLEVLRGAG